MDLFEAISGRYSYRGSYADKAVTREDLKKIVEAGLKAPSGRNQQTTRFVIVDDPLLVRQIGQMHTMKAMQQAKAFIACIIDKEPVPVYEGYSFQVEDCAVAAENMLLAITALGYASVWIDGWLRLEQRAEKIGNLLGVPGEKTVRVLLPLGVPKEPGPRQGKKPFEQRVGVNRYAGGQQDQSL